MAGGPRAVAQVRITLSPFLDPSRQQLLSIPANTQRKGTQCDASRCLLLGPHSLATLVVLATLDLPFVLGSSKMLACIVMKQ